MNPLDIFKIASKIETPLMLAGLVVLVLFELIRRKIPDGQAKMLFVLALVTIVLAIAADLVRARIQPPLRYWVDGRVHSPPADPTAGVPRATVYFSTHEQGVVQTCTDTYGYFKFEIPPASLGKTAELWVDADKYQHSDLRKIDLTTYVLPQEFGILSAPEKATSKTVATADEAPKPTLATACLEGEWHEQLVGRPDQANTLQWRLTMQGTTLRISRQDDFVHGVFTQSDGDWKGDLNWNNGDTWHNVVLKPSADCHTIATNQSWYYRR